MRTIIAFILLLSTLGKVQSQIIENSKTNVIDSLLIACHNQGLFNGVALISDGGKIILHKPYGLSDLHNQTPLELTDRFYIGSLTKQFTSVLILQLQEDELIHLDTPISEYLEEFSDSTFANITIHQLLTHTSGLGNYTSHPDFNKSKRYSNKEMFDLIKEPLLFPPGSKWSYSNSGYFLLGKIAERVTNRDYGSLLYEKIFEPLEMINTSFSNEWLNKNVAKGYVGTIEGIKPMPSYSPASLFSTGGIYSTAQDLYIWTQALDGNKLLTEKSKEILLQPIQNDYACGLYVKKGIDSYGNKFERHFHGGIIQGYHSFILKRVPQKQVIILLDNFYSQEIATIKNRIWSALIEEEVREIKPKLSNLLYSASSGNTLAKMIDSISKNIELFESQYTFEEFDINKVAYRLMEAERFSEARHLFTFNIDRYPKSWNVYDSMGELELIQGNYKYAKQLYKQSLTLNADNTSAKVALENIALYAVSKTFLFVGSYTEGRVSKGIYVFDLNTNTGEIKEVESENNLINPSFLAISPNGKFLYACTETKLDKPGTVSAFKIDSLTGEITFLNKQTTGGKNPVHIEIDKKNKYVIVSNYTDPGISVFECNSDGSLKPFSELIEFKGNSVISGRQDKAHIHSSNFSPDNKFLFVTDLGSDKIYVFKFDPESLLTPVDSLTIITNKGSGPRHFTFHPKESFAYCVEELSGTVSSYGYKEGQLSRLNTYKSYEHNSEEYASSDIHVSPDGKYLYVANRQDENSISIFEINPINGELTLIAHQETYGTIPRSFVISPSGKFLIVANQTSNNLVVFDRDIETGLLTKIGQTKGLKYPSSLKIIRYDN
jgi:6-phosphogluconolactonase